MDCLLTAQDEYEQIGGSKRRGRSRSSTDLKVCPVCRTLEVSENIGPALFFSNLVPEIQALERCWFPNPKDEEEVVKNEDTEEEKEVDREEVVEEEEKEEVEEEAKHEDKTEDKEDGKENKVILTSTSTLQNDNVGNGNSAVDEEHTLCVEEVFNENKMEQKSSPNLRYTPRPDFHPVHDATDVNAPNQSLPVPVPVLTSTASPDALNSVPELSQEESQILALLSNHPPPVDGSGGGGGRADLTSNEGDASCKMFTSTSKRAKYELNHEYALQALKHDGTSNIDMKENQDCHEVSSSGSNNNDNNNKQFTLEEETMILSENETYCNFPVSLGQQDSLASWGKDIMNSDGNHIQAIIDNHSHNHYQNLLHGGSHLYGDSDVEVVKYAQQQQQQGMVLSSQQTTVDSNHENGCDLTRRVSTASPAAASEISLSASPVLDRSHLNHKEMNNTDTMNQIILASWGKDIEGSELLGIEKMIEEQEYLHRQEREEQQNHKMQLEGVESEEIGSVIHSNDASIGVEVTQSTSNKSTRPVNENAQRVLIGFSDLSEKHLSSLQECKLRGWVDIVQMNYSNGLRNGDDDEERCNSTIWVQEEEEHHYFKCRRTLSYLRALVRGQLIVSAEWFSDSIAHGNDHLLKRYNYEISGSIEDKIVGAPSRSRKMTRNDEKRSTLLSKFSFQFVSVENDCYVDFSNPKTRLRTHSPHELTVDEHYVDIIDKGVGVEYEDYGGVSSHDVVSIYELVRCIYLCGGHVYTEEQENNKSVQESIGVKRLGVLVPNEMVIQTGSKLKQQIQAEESIVCREYFEHIVSMNWIMESIWNQNVFEPTEWREPS